MNARAKHQHTQFRGVAMKAIQPAGRKAVFDIALSPGKGCGAISTLPELWLNLDKNVYRNAYLAGKIGNLAFKYGMNIR